MIEYIQFWLWIIKGTFLWLILPAPLDILQPFEKIEDARVSSAEFVAHREKHYAFSLAFVRPDKISDIDKQEKITGTAYEHGTPISVQITVHRNNRIFLNQEFFVDGTYWTRTYSLGGRTFHADMRLVHTVKLPPGDYKVAMRFTDKNLTFENIEMYGLYRSFRSNKN
ncbi:DUF5625 family protein [Pseudomonas sp. UBA6562]|uniref:DUF5625 family protein n=1 Tax=Pseudomonas sp. UBA6562 TaxID=1947332 RepID=UPI0025D8287F|nr:DUF5625 family protein [Pseudomonas sp. UBA6562]